MKEQDVGILVTLSKQDSGNYVIRFDHVQRSDKDSLAWKKVRVDTEFSLSEEKFNERADYGLTEEVKEHGKIPLRFSLGSNLLSVIKVNKKHKGF